MKIIGCLLVHKIINYSLRYSVFIRPFREAPVRKADLPIFG